MSARKVGDVVVLNSGGPPMRIFAIHADEALVCWWHEQAVRTWRFPLVCLRPDFLPVQEPPPLPHRPA
jgi:uncharacterized protein YodC (DUF2158 family)